MTKKKKIILLSTLTTIPIAAITSIVSYSVYLNNSHSVNEKDDLSNLSNNLNNSSSNNLDSSKKVGYIYNDEFYSDINDIVKLYSKNNEPISSDYYIGDFISAFDYQNKTLKMDFLRQYIEEKIYPAYETAGGLITNDFNKAKKSFFDSSKTEILYTDFNGHAYRDKNDAKNAIKESKNASSILFYTLPDGTKINPLNKNDINFFKKAIYEQIYNYLYGGSKLDSNVSISLYDYGTYKKENVDNVLISSKYSNAFYNKDSILESLLSDILFTIYESQRDYIFQNVKFDVELVVHNTFKRKDVWAQKLSDIPSKYNGKYKYGITELRFNENTEKKYPKPILNITNRSWDKMKKSGAFGGTGDSVSQKDLDSFNNDPLNYNNHKSSYGQLVRGDDWGIYDIDFSKEDSITFPSVPLNELSDFSPFLSETSFKSNKEFQVKQKKLNNGASLDMSYAYEVSNFRGCTFIVPFFHKDKDFDLAWGNANGVDFDLFKFGTHSSKETWDLTGTFDVVLKKSSSTNVSEEKMFEFIKQRINTKYMNPNEGDLSCLLFNKILLFIEKIFKNNSNLLWNEISSLLKDDNWLLKFTNNSSDLQLDSINNNPKQLFSMSNDFSSIDSENPLWFNKKLNNDLLSFKKIENNKTNILNGIDINYDNWFSKNINNESLNKILSLNKLKLVVEYNNNPLFMINEDISLLNDGEKYSSGISFKSLIKKYFFNKKIPSEDDLNKMTNISQDFSSALFSSSSNLHIYNTVNYYNSLNLSNKSRITKLEDGKWKFNYKDNDEIFAESLMPELHDIYKPEDNTLDKNKINLIVKIYNELYENSKNAINNLTDPDNIIFLFNRFDGNKLNGLNLKFRKFLGQEYTNNPSLSGGQSIEFYDNLSDLDWAIQNKLQIEPGTIVILRDNDGNVINPGIQISEQEEIWLTSDAVYGSESIMRDNFLRTKIIKPMKDKVYYKENGNTTTLISNDINRVFKLTLPDKNSSTGGTITHYFLSYDDCYNNLVSYVSTLCTTVILK